MLLSAQRAPLRHSSAVRTLSSIGIAVAGRHSCLTALVLAMIASSPVAAQTTALSPSPVLQVIAYVFPNQPEGRLLTATDVDPSKLTRINYAFALLENGKVVEGNPNDAANLKTLTALKRSQPSLEVLISIGGWLGSGGFSDAALTPESRSRFVSSALEFLTRYDLDGIDIDWEYPGQSGAGNRFRPEDGANFTLLLASLRKALDEHSRHIHRPLRLTIAAAASSQFLSSADMAGSARLLDQINLMAYDYYEPGDGTRATRTGNHAPLFADPSDPQHASGADAVRSFEAVGVPASKLVLGVPFYGHAWADVPPIGHGLFQTGVAAPDLQTSYPDVQTLLTKGFTRYWDDASQVPFAYSDTSHQFLSYEDPASLRAKASFVRDQHLGGMMFWQYFSDPSGALLNALYDGLHPSATTTPRSPAPGPQHTPQP